MFGSNWSTPGVGLSYALPDNSTFVVISPQEPGWTDNYYVRLVGHGAAIICIGVLVHLFQRCWSGASKSRRRPRGYHAGSRRRGLRRCRRVDADDESTAGFRLARLAAILPVTTPTLSPQRIAPTIQRPGEGYQISPVHAHKHSTRGVRKDPRIAWDDAASGSLQAILDDGDVQVDSHIYSVGVNCEDNSGMQLVIDVIDNGEAEYDDHE